MKKVKLKETKVLLTKSEDLLLEKIAHADGGRSKTKFCTNEIRKIIKVTFTNNAPIISLTDVKNIVAKQWGKKSWADVLKDYEYGIGLSKLIGFEDLMDDVAERYKDSTKLHIINLHK